MTLIGWIGFYRMASAQVDTILTGCKLLNPGKEQTGGKRLVEKIEAIIHGVFTRYDE